MGQIFSLMVDYIPSISIWSVGGLGPGTNASPRAIHKLPLELVITVLEHCDREDIASVRLVNKIFANVATPLLFEHLRLYLLVSSFDKLHSIAHSEYAQYVKRITIFQNMLPESDTGLRLLYGDEILPNLCEDMQDSEIIMRTYHKMKQEQDIMMEAVDVRLAFEASISRLPALEMLDTHQLSYSEFKVKHPDHEFMSMITASKQTLQSYMRLDSFLDGRIGLHYPGRHAPLLDWIITALTYRHHVQAKHIQVLMIRSQAGRPHHLNWHQTSTALAALRVVRMHKDEANEGFWVELSDFFGNVLSRLVNVEDLTIVLGSRKIPIDDWSSTILDDAPLNEILATVVLPRLTKLSIWMTITNASLESFLRSHPTLRHLTIDMMTEDHFVMLDIIHDCTNLDTIQICGLGTWAELDMFEVPLWLAFDDSSDWDRVNKWLLHQQSTKPACLLLAEQTFRSAWSVLLS